MVRNGLPPIHPGAFLREILVELALSQAQFARTIGVAPMRISHVIKGTRPVTADLAKTEANLGVAEKIEDLKPCHVVVEAVFENLEVKQKLFGELEAVVSPEAILASNTSSIRIASIARSLKHRGRVCGMHYFNPVPLMKLVEVIRAADTAPDVVTAMVALGKRQTRVPVVVGDMGTTVVVQLQPGPTVMLTSRRVAPFSLENLPNSVMLAIDRQ